MLDRYIAKRSIQKDVFSDTYRPDQAIVTRFMQNPKGRNLRVLFPAWHDKGWLYSNLAGRWSERDDAVLSYYFHDELLKPDIDTVWESMAYLRDTITQELREAVENNHYDSVSLHGMSLGTVVMANVATLFGGYDSAQFVCPHANLASSVWNGIRMPHFKDEFKRRRYSYDMVNAGWQDISPENLLPEMAGKQVQFIISSTDKIVPAADQQQLVATARDIGLQPEVITTRLGHYAAIARFMINGVPPHPPQAA